MPEHKQPPNQYEAAFLKRRYQPYGDNRKLAHHLGLSVTALDARARELGIPSAAGGPGRRSSASGNGWRRTIPTSRSPSSSGAASPRCVSRPAGWASR